jgi:hypothetical protein
MPLVSRPRARFTAVGYSDAVGFASLQCARGDLPAGDRRTPLGIGIQPGSSTYFKDASAHLAHGAGALGGRPQPTFSSENRHAPLDVRWRKTAVFKKRTIKCTFLP